MDDESITAEEYRGLLVKRHKYGAKRTIVDGIPFPSKAEAEHYQRLKLLEAGKAISGLVLQPDFPIIVNGVKICLYVADFLYWLNGIHVVDDVKGFSTPAFRLKFKLAKALYGHQYDFRIVKD